MEYRINLKKITLFIHDSRSYGGNLVLHKKKAIVTHIMCHNNKARHSLLQKI